MNDYHDDIIHPSPLPCFLMFSLLITILNHHETTNNVVRICKIKNVDAKATTLWKVAHTMLDGLTNYKTKNRKLFSFFT